MNRIEVIPCDTPRLKTRFERLAEELHGARPEFVPPVPGAVAKFLGARSAFLRNHGEIAGFVALRDGRPVGRIAAIHNRTHNKYHKDKTGFFGFFECENDPSAAMALFDQAGKWLAERGLDSIRGPYNPSINDDCGVLLDGYHEPSCIGLPWNPEFYPSLIVQCGFEQARKLLVLDLPLHRLELPARLERVTRRIAARNHLTVRTFDMRRLPEELRVLHEVYNHTLERNWGFVPLGYEELLEAAGDLRAIADPRLLLVGECAGKRAGVAVTLPNINELLARIKKTPHFLRLPHLFLLMKTRRIRTCRQTILGVMPEFRDRGLHAWLIFEQFRMARELHTDAVLGWVEENNTEIFEVSQLTGATIGRSWGIYSKPLPGN